MVGGGTLGWNYIRRNASLWWTEEPGSLWEINSGGVEGAVRVCQMEAYQGPPYPSWSRSWRGPWEVGVEEGHTSCQPSREVGVEGEAGHQGVEGAVPPGEAVPRPWVGVAED